MRLLLLLSAVLTGCSLFGGESEIVVDVRLSPEAMGLATEVTVAGDRAPLRILAGGYSRTDTVTVSTGPAVVACTVSSGAAVTTGSVQLDLTDGWRYPVTCAVQAMNPADACFGCRGSEGFPLDPALGVPSDQTLWVVWAGDSIDNPPLY